MATLEQMRAALDLEVATEFLLIAAVLLELKARRLLPGRDDVELEEELALWEERDLLLARLLECKTFKDAAGSMQRLMDTAGPVLAPGGRARRALRRPRPRPARRRHPRAVAGRPCRRCSAPRPATRLLLDHVAPVRISVRDAVDELLDELPGAGRISFSRLTGRPGRAAGDHRAVPGPAGAVQAGPGGAWSRPPSFGELHVHGWLGAAGARRARRRRVPGLAEWRPKRSGPSRPSSWWPTQPVEPSLLAQLLEVSPARVEELCAELAAAYRDEDRGFELVRVAGGYRFQSHADLAPYVERFVLEGQTARLSAAALETLAIVAYKQPVSRAQIAVHPGGQRRRGDPHPARPGVHRRGRPGPGPGPGGAVRHDGAAARAAGPGPDRGPAAAGRVRPRPGDHGRPGAQPACRPAGVTSRGDDAARSGTTVTEPDGERLQKVLAQGGVGSRRARARSCIAGGAGSRSTARSPPWGRRVDARPPTGCAVDGVAIGVHGPAWSTTCSTSRPAWSPPPPTRRAGPTVTALVPPEPRVHPVGRLDADSEGLLLLTNDGDLTLRLTHPRFGVEKEYLVMVEGTPGPGGAPAARGRGARGRPHRPGPGVAVGPHGLRITIHEGRNRQVRRMCDAVGHPVRRLVRTRIGPIRDRRAGAGAVAGAAPGEVRALSWPCEQAVRATQVAPPRLAALATVATRASSRPA